MYISRVFSNITRNVLSQRNTRLRLLDLLHDIEVMWSIGLDGAETNCGIARISGILLMNGYGS